MKYTHMVKINDNFNGTNRACGNDPRGTRGEGSSQNVCTQVDCAPMETSYFKVEQLQLPSPSTYCIPPLEHLLISHLDCLEYIYTQLMGICVVMNVPGVTQTQRTVNIQKRHIVKCFYNGCKHWRLQFRFYTQTFFRVRQTNDGVSTNPQAPSHPMLES